MEIHMLANKSPVTNCDSCHEENKQGDVSGLLGEGRSLV